MSVGKHGLAAAKMVELLAVQPLDGNDLIAQSIEAVGWNQKSNRVEALKVLKALAGAKTVKVANGVVSLAKTSEPLAFQPSPPLPVNNDQVQSLQSLLTYANQEKSDLQHQLKILEDEYTDLAKAFKDAEDGRPLEIVLTDGKKVKVEGRPHKQFGRVLKLVNARLNVLLVGPAGTGKTYLASQIAKTLGLTFAHVSCSAGMSEGTLLGRLLPTGEGGRFEYTTSEFVRSYETGGLFLFDEIDAADSNLMVVVNSALANGHLAIPNRIDNPAAKKHPKFVCVAAANTYGTGADRMYVGRNQLDEATLDRFRLGQVEVNYDPDVEKQVCPDDDLRNRFLTYRNRVQAAGLRRLVSMRAMEQAYAAKQAGVTDQEIDQSLFAGWSADEVKRVKL